MTSQSFEFRDVESGDAGYCAIRMTATGIGIALSLKSDGDLEVSLTTDDARRIAEMILGLVSNDG